MSVSACMYVCLRVCVQIHETGAMDESSVGSQRLLLQSYCVRVCAHACVRACVLRPQTELYPGNDEKNSQKSFFFFLTCVKHVCVSWSCSVQSSYTSNGILFC